MKGDDYSKGRHFWVHFTCGTIVGGIFGLRVAWGMFQSLWACAATAIAITLVFAICAGLIGDPFWHWWLGA